MFCNHRWKVLSETKTESTAEKVKRMGMTPVNGTAFSSRDFEQELIQIVSCEKCGKLKQFVTDV